MKVKTSANFLDDLQNKLGVNSDYAVGKIMGMASQRLSHYRQLKGAFDDETCLKVADVLEIDPAYVVACAHHQREKSKQVKQLWEKIATLALGVTAVLAIFSFLPFVHLDANGFAPMLVGFTGTGRCILCQIDSIANYWPIAALFVALLLALPRHNPNTKSPDHRSRK